MQQVGSWRDDNLQVCQTNRPCAACAPEPHQCPPRRRCHTCIANRGRRRSCQACGGIGFPLSDALRGLWRNRAGFLVCGGPSLATLDLDRLRERGVVSLAINNAGAFAPVKAHVFGDPETKFHSAQFLAPDMISFVPIGKLHNRLQIKHAGEFYPTDVRVCDCPNVWGISRASRYNHETFLSDPSAHWGRKGQQLQTVQGQSKLCTMLLGLRLLHYLGCCRIYLIGVDFWVPSRESGEPGYAWGDQASCGNRIFADKIDPMMEELKPVFESHGIDIFNCNELSRCRAFPYVPFDEAVTDCKGPVEDEPLDVHDWYNKDKAAADRAKHPTPLTEQQIISLRRRAPRLNQPAMSLPLLQPVS